MTQAGGCRCGTVRYEVEGEALYSALCHCGDCRKSAGAPIVAWTAFREDQFRLTHGEPKTINSSGAAFRSFCPDCGTGLYYRNQQILPGIVDVQSASLDDPSAFPPQLHVQVAERINWMETAHSLPTFDRYPAPN